MNNKMFFTGLSMIVLNIIGIFAYVLRPTLTNVSVSKLLAFSIYGAFTLFSIIFLIWGAVKDE